MNEHDLKKSFELAKTDIKDAISSLHTEGYFFEIDRVHREPHDKKDFTITHEYALIEDSGASFLLREELHAAKLVMEITPLYRGEKNVFFDTHTGRTFLKTGLHCLYMIEKNKPFRCNAFLKHKKSFPLYLLGIVSKSMEKMKPKHSFPLDDFHIRKDIFEHEGENLTLEVVCRDEEPDRMHSIRWEDCSPVPAYLTAIENSFKN